MNAGPGPKPPRWWSPLQHRTYRNLWLFSCFSSLGALVQAVGAAWMMASLEPSALMVTLIAAAVTVPPILLSIPAGVLADSFEKRRVMLAAQTGMMVASVLLAILAFAGRIDASLLLLFTFLIGCGQALNTPAWMASIADLVPRRDLPGAIMLNSIGFNLTRTAGPALGGIILAIGGASATFAFNAVSYVGEIAVLLRWKPAPGSKAGNGQSLGGLYALFRGTFFAARLPSVRRLLVHASLFGWVAAALPALLPVLVRLDPTRGALAYGVTLAMFGVGALAGGIAGSGLRDRLGSTGLLVLALGATSAGLLLAALFTASLIGLSLGMALAGAGWVWGFAGLNIEAQLSAEPGAEGRVIALYQLAAFAGLTAGNVGWGALTDALGPSIALVSVALSGFGTIISLARLRPRSS